MFNHTFKKDALTIHAQAVERYNNAYEELINSCDTLYQKRVKAIEKIEEIQDIVNSIANSPKEFETQMGQVQQEVLTFRETEEYAREALSGEVKSGAGVLSGVALGGAIASLAPTAALGIATTFGHATTGTAISALSGAAQQKAALAWIGRMSQGIATKGIIQGAGMKAGAKLLAWAGPIGWTTSAVMTAASVTRMSSKNKKVAKEAIKASKEIMEGKYTIDRTAKRVETLEKETYNLFAELSRQVEQIQGYLNADYKKLVQEEKLLLGTVVNNTLALAMLVNRTVD